MEHLACLLLTVVPASALEEAREPGSIDEIMETGVSFLLDRQEGDDAAEWPYEGVYRLRGEIPHGYRVGGTAICASALIHAPGFERDEARRAAVSRAIRFVIREREEAEMGHEVPRTYDVRGWGYAYGLRLLLLAKRLDLIPSEESEEAEQAILHYLRGIEATAIPERGGWNYARRKGFAAPGDPSPFMTAATLRALFAARDAGYAVDEGIVNAALDALEDSRTSVGSVAYSGSGAEGRGGRTAVPGAVARMAAVESALFLAKRGGLERVRAAVDAFIVHWDRLEERRARPGTHEGPYGIAPYYFYFGHLEAALAVELLPAHERAEYRERLRELLMRTRDPETGTWNDRVFPRSASYGTAMAMLSLMAKELPQPGF